MRDVVVLVDIYLPSTDKVIWKLLWGSSAWEAGPGDGRGLVVREEPREVTRRRPAGWAFMTPPSERLARAWYSAGHVGWA